MKHKIHFHSDCPFFGGCENMLPVFFENETFRKSFDVSFSYGKSREYEKGLKERVRTEIPIYPLNTALRDVGHRSKAYNVLVRILNNILKYPYFIRNVYSIYGVIKKEDPDIVHINNGGYPGAYSCSAAVFSARLAGKKRIVYVVNNIAFSGFSIRRKLDFWIDRFLAKNVSRFLTGSMYAGKRLQEVLKFEERQLVSIPNAAIPRSADESREETRRKYGFGADDLLIGNVAVFEERKGHKYLLDAFRELREELGRRMNLKLVIAGFGPLEEEIKEKVRSEKLEDCVRIVREKNVYNIFNAIDFFVLPSIGLEDFPYVIIEAMSMGKPVIGTRVAGIPEQISDGLNGYLVDPKDVKSLKEAMKKIAQSKLTRERMGEESKKIYEGQFTEAIVVEKYINFYNTLLTE